MSIICLKQSVGWRALGSLEYAILFKASAIVWFYLSWILVKLVVIIYKYKDPWLIFKYRAFGFGWDFFLGSPFLGDFWAISIILSNIY